MELAAAFAAGMRAVVKQERDEFSLEYPCHSPDGQRWFIGRVTRLSGKGPVRLVVAHEHITEQKRAENTLAEIEDRYRSLVASSMDAVLLTSPDGHVLAANEAACRMFGRSEQELIQAGRSAVLDASDPRLAAALEERARTGKFRGELTFLRRDGTRFPCEISSVSFTDRHDEVRTGIAIRDITDRKQAEVALRESEERFRLFMDNSPTIAWIKDEHGRYVYLSHTYEDRFRVRLEDWRGRTDAELWPAEVAGTYRRNDRAVLEAGHAIELVEETIDADGSCRYCSLPSSHSATPPATAT
jgi:PAS domain S-box-containing protein